MLTEPQLFRPRALAKAPIVSEGHIERDLTMPERDWSEFDTPAKDRRTSRIIRNEVSNERRS